MTTVRKIYERRAISEEERRGTATAVVLEAPAGKEQAVVGKHVRVLDQGTCHAHRDVEIISVGAGVEHWAVKLQFQADERKRRAVAEGVRPRHCAKNIVRDEGDAVKPSKAREEADASVFGEHCG